MTVVGGMRYAGTRGTVVPVRAREPDRSGYAARAGVRLHYEVFGDGPITVFLLAPWSIVHSRMWKLQVPHLARRWRVVTMDGRGNGGSDRPAGPAAYADEEMVADVLAVMDASGTDAAVLVGLSLGGRLLLRLASDHPERVLGAVFVAAAVQVRGDRDRRLDARFDEPYDPDDPLTHYTANYITQDQRGFADWFFRLAFPEPHSTKGMDDSADWAMETDAETLVATRRAPRFDTDPERGRAEVLRMAGLVSCPSLVVHGDRDAVVPHRSGQELAAALDAPLATVVGGGHCVPVRHPVWFNRTLDRFLERVASGAVA
jgi:pimeloyl-ACP methyl ester carboxylesterase